jgi:phytoene dehydrogenase-like protein
MGTVACELEETARKNGAEFLTKVELTEIDLAGEKKTVAFQHNGKSGNVEARFLLVNFGRNVLGKYSGRPWQPKEEDEGSVFKINMLLRRFPKLKATKYPAADAFRGTFHSDEGYEQMSASYEQAANGRLPEKTPCEVYCHTLTDDSILGADLRRQGFQTMTLFGLDAPYSLFAKDPPSPGYGVVGNDSMRTRAEKKFLESINQWLEEPLEDCLAVARDGSLCIESKSPVDIEESLGMYHGNIFHDAPSFPYAETKEQAGTWGVETEFDNVFLCGSSAQRGGAVSGIPGHNAAMKVLATL